MDIILNEKEWAESAIVSKQLGSKPTVTLKRVARYLRQINGYKKTEVRKRIGDFLFQCDPNARLNKWDKILDSIADDSDKYSIVNIESIGISKAELDIIGTLPDRQPKRLAFVLLVAAKYYNAVNDMNNGWVHFADKDIMKMANINTTVRRQSQMFREIRDAGLIHYSSKVDNLKVQILFLKPDSPSVIHITDCRNLGNQYLLYCGEPYFQCAQCGLTIKKKHNVHKYCSDCASEMYIKKSVESVMRRRESATTHA